MRTTEHSRSREKSSVIWQFYFIFSYVTTSIHILTFSLFYKKQKKQVYIEQIDLNTDHIAHL